jgi:hypothetical protein
MDKENKTPEQHWEDIKQKLYKGKIPESTDRKVNKALNDAEDETEKWEVLMIFMETLRNKLGY